MSVTILLVEDDPVLLTVLRELLEFGGHSVVTCENGREAVQQLSMAHIDLVICTFGRARISPCTSNWPFISELVFELNTDSILQSAARPLQALSSCP